MDLETEQIVVPLTCPHGVYFMDTVYIHVHTVCEAASGQTKWGNASVDMMPSSSSSSWMLDAVPWVSRSRIHTFKVL